MKYDVKKHVRNLRQDMLSFTRDLIRIRTDNPPGNGYEKCVRLIAKKLRQFGLHPRVLEVQKPGLGVCPRWCVLVSYGYGKPTLYFHGHYDVVPASNPNQFNPRSKGNRLYGRGASDMKGGLCAMIYALRIMQLVDLRLRGRVTLVIVPDEETGGKYGTQYLFERGYIKKVNSIGMLMPEPTSGAIWNACRGACSLLVSVRGKPVHVVLQSRGINAYEQMLAVANALLRIKETVEKRKTSYAVASGQSKNSILMLGGTCRCGTNFNIVPGDCTFSIERRINPEENLDKEKQRLSHLFERLRGQGTDVTATVLQEGESAGISPDHFLAKALTQSIRETYGKRPGFYMCPGLLEIRYYIRHGIPAYAYGPGELSCAHGPNEFINVERMYRCAGVYALTALRLLARG